jgi:hypothetical protein
MNNRNNFIIAVLIVLFVCTGFFREYVFLNWNEQMRVSYYGSPDSHVSPMMSWLSTFSYNTLYWMKWPLTLAFSIVFAVYAYLTVRVAFHERNYNRITIAAYCCVFIVSFAFFGFGWLVFGARDASYEIARFLAGLIETPVMLIVLIASFMIHRRL